MSICLIILTHSDYNFLWDIIDDLVINVKNINPIFVSNNTNITKPKNFNSYIEYDDEKCYFTRLRDYILPLIKCEYILLVHDVQLVTYCNIDYINRIVNIMNENYIDRCSLNLFKGKDIINKDDISLCNLQKAIGNTYTPYDVCPSIWNVKSLFKLVSQFPYETYRNRELNKELINYCNNNFKIYGINKKEDEEVYYCIGRPYSKNFKILFITIQGEIIYPFEAYMDGLEEFRNIQNKYNIIERVNKIGNFIFVLNNFKPL